MRVICTSDTHGYHDAVTVPDGDLLIHAGDFTMMGRADEVTDFVDWMASLPHREKVVICGNHEKGLEGLSPTEIRRRLDPLTYVHGGTFLDGLGWGGPWQPWFMDWAFNVPRGKLAPYWDKIPSDVRVLVTHGGPHDILDTAEPIHDEGVGEHVGCRELSHRLGALGDLRLHVFGHIHEAYGVERVNGTTFVNASICDLRYRPVNPPVVVDLDL